MEDSQYATLLFAIGLSGTGLAMALFGNWLTRRSERFMLTWALGVVVLVATVLAFIAYDATPVPLVALGAFCLMLLSFSILLGAARQFRTDRPAVRLVALAFGVALALVAPFFIVGIDGLGALVGNAVGAALLALMAREYWIARAEAPVPLIGLTVLYLAAGLSFALCAVALGVDRQWVLSSGPSGWAENLNLYVSIVGVTGVGALSLALNQTRLARRHRLEAMTDQLTGLLNRRALFDRIGGGAHDEAAVVLVDLDHFKTINDTHGHDAGDLVLREFAALVRLLIRPEDIAARIGGEEFVLVLFDCAPERAREVAERLRVAFADRMDSLAAISVRATASAGVARIDERGFGAALSAADAALYRAKDLGRDRVVMAAPRLAA